MFEVNDIDSAWVGIPSSSSVSLPPHAYTVKFTMTKRCLENIEDQGLQRGKPFDLTTAAKSLAVAGGMMVTGVEVDFEVIESILCSV